MVNKKDIAQIRKPEDLDRRFDFGQAKKDIKKAQEDIQGNTEDIKVNSKDIEQNTENIKKNSESIEQNSKNIKQNAKSIEENAKRIEQNTKDIEANTKEIEKNSNARHNHENKELLDSITEEEYNRLKTNEHTHQNKNILDEIEGTEIFDLEQLKNENMSNLIGDCISKNKRVVMNVSADIEILAGTETTLFNLPLILTKEIKFLIHSNTEIVLGTLGIDGVIKVVFNNDVSNICFNLIFDL